jgi:nicotinamide mononucleotide transporter
VPDAPGCTLKISNFFPSGLSAKIDLLQFYCVDIIAAAEILSALTCLWAIWLNTRRKTAGWPIGLISVLLAALVYFDEGLYAECGLQFFYLISGVYGWRQWRTAENISPESQVWHLPMKRNEAITGILLALIASFFIYMVLQRFSGAASPLPDALITGFSLLAQVWLARKKPENWLLWMLLNIGSVGLYLQRELWFFAGLYFLLLLLAVRGYLSWKKTMQPC